ncbi:hypothetical protein A4G26_11425 [Mycobacterium kansasii]|uniref:AB hydrolase-1 domain-containing protein n=1 Tax=Mycobacterium innocens TaxID=2341083 RepID=A0A498PR42_9MYCO|nr:MULTISPECIES: hypothetical protein [Mycobacterium]KZS60640.1 hypothetical protein A4G26_11425 [Mycobacterium kansasii]VBA36119.1 hypothetical protein LAUMK13_01003 [Mycobacterium innocens]
MYDTEHVVLIHGVWGTADGWAPARAAFEQRGFTVHTPTLRHHELPLQEGAMKDRYQQGTSVEIAGADHLVFWGRWLPATMGHIEDWMAENRVFAHSA